MSPPAPVAVFIERVRGDALPPAYLRPGRVVAIHPACVAPPAATPAPRPTLACLLRRLARLRTRQAAVSAAIAVREAELRALGTAITEALR